MTHNKSKSLSNTYDLIGAIATMVGCVIGAGIFAIPYVVSKSGFFTGVLNIIFLGIIMMILHLMLGEIALRTRGSHQLVGYAEKYLGRYGKHIIWLTMLVLTYSALIAYVLKVGDFLYILLNPFFGGNPLLYSIYFFILMSIFLLFNIRVIEKSEVISVSLMLGVLIALSLYSLPHVNKEYFTTLELSKFFIPYGVVLFAYLGIVSIPEMKEELKGKPFLLKKAIIIGCLIPIIVYLLFSSVIVGVTGPNTSDDAIVGLGNVLGYNFLVIGTLIGIFSMTGAFIIISFSIKKMYEFDYHVNKVLAWLLTCIVPISALLLGIRSFVNTLSFAGSISGGILCLMIVLMFLRAKKLGNKKPAYSFNLPYTICWLMVLVFLIGIVNEILGLL